MYTHYDVQAPDPLEKWTNPPFAATIKDHKIIGRGAADSKGNLLAFLKAIETYNKTMGSLPVTMRFLFEGEEEAGSPHLPVFIEANKAPLLADAVVCFDGGTHPSGRPEIDLGLKGIFTAEFHCQEAMTDLHSMWAPLVENAAGRLIQALSTLKTRDGKIAIRGWYDEVQTPSKEELDTLNSIPFDETQLQKEFGVDHFVGAIKGRDALRALIFEPTANISGLNSGYHGLGGKTLLPSYAFARADFRLVPEQDPRKLFQRLQEHLQQNGFEDIQVTLRGYVQPSRTPVVASIARVVTKAAREAYGTEPVVYPNSPGSGPDYLFTKRLGLGSIWTGSSPPFSNAHAPNEFTTIDAYRQGILYATAIIKEFSKAVG